MRKSNYTFATKRFEVNTVTRRNRMIVWLIVALLVVGGFFNLIQRQFSTQYVQAAVITLPTIKPQDLIKPYTISNQPQVYAKSAILVDKASKFPLLEQNDHAHVPIASTTKLMTALVALQNYKLNDVVTITSHATDVVESKIHLQVGERITVQNLIIGMLVNSGNDAAYALADHDPAGFSDFIAKMNQKAKEIGLRDTHYTDPAGLDDNAYSSAFDLSVVASLALDNPIIREVVATPTGVVYDVTKTIAHPLENSDRLIESNQPEYLPEAIGVKTGFTDGAGHCLVSAIKYKGHTLIGVILNTNVYTADASAQESYKLLQWGKWEIDQNQ